MPPSTMRVAVYHSNADIRIEERPVPAIGHGEMLVRVRASGVCGSDVMEWYRKPQAPVVLGHELAGEVAAVGKGVRGWIAGDRVVGTHHVPCLACRRCKARRETLCDTLRTTHFDPGGFAEFLRLTPLHVKHGVLKLPPRLTFEEGSFAEPLACVVRGQRAAGVSKGKTVLVLGSGLTGLLHIQLARVAGARVAATDVSPLRMKAAERFGARLVLDARLDVARELRKANDGGLADVVVVSTGQGAAIQQAFATVEPGGTILFFAPTAPDARVEVPFNRIWREEVHTVSSYGAVKRDLQEALRLIASRKVNVTDMITHRLPLERTQEAFRLTAEGGESLKVIVNP